MAHPASAPADGPEPYSSTDPGDPGWRGYRQAMISEAREARLVVELMGAYPGDPRVLQLAGAILKSLQAHVLDESILKAERQRAYEQGVADCKAARCRLEVIPGGRR